MEITKEQFVAKLMAQGIDEAIAESLYKGAMKGAPKKRRGNPAAGADRPKKHIGRFEFTEICLTCGSRTTKRLIMEIDPNKPRSTEVPVNVCNACIPNYMKMTPEELICLIILKDHPDVGFRMLSNKQQIKLAKSGKTPTELLNTRLDLEPAPDTRHLKPQYDEPFQPVDEVLVSRCQGIYDKARKALGPDLGGHSLLDLLADNTEETTDDLRRVLPFIKRH